MSEAALLPGMPVPQPVDDTVRGLLAARAADDDPAIGRARGMLRRAVAEKHPAVVSGALSGWLQLWRQGIHSVFVVDGVELERYSILARATLRLDGHLHGPDARTTGPQIAEGDRIAVTSSLNFGEEYLAPQTLIEVTGIERSRHLVHLAAPAEGATFTAFTHDPAWRGCEHAYAEIGHDQSRGISIANGLSW